MRFVMPNLLSFNVLLIEKLYQYVELYWGSPNKEWNCRERTLRKPLWSKNRLSYSKWTNLIFITIFSIRHCIDISVAGLQFFISFILIITHFLSWYNRICYGQQKLFSATSTKKKHNNCIIITLLTVLLSLFTSLFCKFILILG